MTRDELHQILRSDVIEGAKALLGATLVKGPLRARIVETEAYRAADDAASHAFRGRTPRNWPMFLDSGIAYVYFNYGVHWMLNVSAHPPGDGSAVLIRAAEPLFGLEEMQCARGTTRPKDLLSGPGKLAKAFVLDGSYNGVNLLSSESALHLIPRDEAPEIITTTRIGLAEGKAHDYPWRFLDASRLQWVSRPPAKSGSHPMRSSANYPNDAPEA